MVEFAFLYAAKKPDSFTNNPYLNAPFHQSTTHKCHPHDTSQKSFIHYHKYHFMLRYVDKILCQFMKLVNNLTSITALAWLKGQKYLDLTTIKPNS